MTNIELNGQTILISGGDKCFYKPRIKNWLTKSFKDVVFKEECILINDPIFNNKNEIINFKNSISHKIGDLSISAEKSLVKILRSFLMKNKILKFFPNMLGIYGRINTILMILRLLPRF